MKVAQIPSILRYNSRLVQGWICSRCLSTIPAVASGHSRWSTIKHDKAKNDKQTSKFRNILAEELAQASKLYGPDPQFNPRLASAVATAKKGGLPKATINAAISRGQGISASGKVLESVVVECIGPESVAMVIDCQTDNKLRALQDVRSIIKSHNGTTTPISYMFSKRGRVVFEKHDDLILDDVLDSAIDAGADDVDIQPDGSIVIYTEPTKTIATASVLSQKTGLKIQSSNIFWDPNEDTKTRLGSPEGLQQLLNLIDELQDEPSVQGIYLNVLRGDIDDAGWMELQNRVAV